MSTFKCRLKIPQPITVNDCLLLWQMGYEVEISNGQITKIKKARKKRLLEALKQKLSKLIITRKRGQINEICN